MDLKQDIKLLFRKPWKLILITLIASSFIFSILILLIQFKIDGVIIKYLENNYSMVSTVISEYSDENIKSEYKEINSDLVNILKNSKYINDFEIRNTLSAKLDDYTNVDSYFMFPQTNSIFIFNGILEEVKEIETLNDVDYIKINVKVNEIKAGKKGWISTNETIPIVIIDKKTIAARLEVKKQYQFIAVSSFSDRLGMLPKLLYCYNLDDKTIDNSINAIKDKIILGEGIVDLDNHKKLDDMSDYIGKLKLEIEKLDNIVTVRLVKDMNLIVPVVNEIMFLEDGRFLNESDIGKNFCLISSQLATKNKLSIGDKLNLSLSNNNYNIEGYESGFPQFLEKLNNEYIKSNAYEIVGIYQFSSYDPATARMLYSYNDIFIPKNPNIVSDDYVTPYSMSFRVNVNNFESFQNKVLPQINELGYKTISTQSRWSEVEGNFNSMSNNRLKNIIFAFVIFILGIIILNMIIIQLYKYDYTIRRIFAGETTHINRSYKIPMVLSLCFGNIISLILVKVTYNTVIRKHVEFIPIHQLPSQISILLYSIVVLLILDLIIILFQNLYLKRMKRKNILGLMR